jgi:alpha-L-fucosidase 2
MPDCFYRKEKGLDYPKPTIIHEDDFSSVVQKTKSGFTYFILVYRVSDTSNSLYVTVRKTKNIAKDFEEAKSCLINYHKKVNENHSKHLKYWHSFYRRSSVITGEEKIDRLYNFGRYFLSCNSKGKYPMSLEGVWTRNDGNLPPWKGDYHLDINLRMSYESYMKTGDFKEGKVLVDYLLRNKNKFKKLAKDFCKTDGYYIPGVMSQNCTPLGGWPMYAMNPCNAIWILSAFDNYYRYTGNKSFLEKKAYPFIIQVEKCLSSLMKINRKSKIQFEFSASPEINDCNKNAIFKKQTNFEISMLHYLYRLLIDYSELLNLDPTYFRNQLSSVANYKIGNDGEIIIGDDLTYSESHRHFSHILCHKNLENFTPYKDSKQILIDYKRLEKYGTSEWVGFSFTEAASIASYIELGEEAYRYIYAFSDAFVNDNCFHMNMDFNNKGYSTIYSYAFTLEANMGFVRAVTDMMLRTTRDIITVFPAIPSHFKQNGVKFKNLRAYDNTKVSASFINNSMKFEIKPRIEKTIKIYNNFKDNPTLMVGKEMIQIKALKGEIIQITTKDKITYLGD